MEITRKELAGGVELAAVRTDKFKTGVFSVTLAEPLRAETATANALLGSVLCRGCRPYPDILSISGACDELYGAAVEPCVRQRGESQCVGLSASFIDDRFALDGGGVLEGAVGLCGSLLLDPLLENGSFRAGYVAGEGANLASRIRARVNDKRSWSVFRLTQVMCRGEAYALDKLGSAPQAEGMDARRLWERYGALLKGARIVFYYGGSAEIGRVEDAVRSAFAPLLTGRERELPCRVKAVPDGAVRQVTERMDVSQGKLAMGFRTGGVTRSTPLYPALLVCNALYGGGPNSKLFLNVREKLSLCYYASSMLDKLKGIMAVACGTEFEKMDEARDEVLAQLEAVRRGDFTEEELTAARRAVTGILRTALDSQGRLEDYWTCQAISGGAMEGPEQLIPLVEAVSAEEVSRAAQGLRLDTVYYLVGKEAR